MIFSTGPLYSGKPDFSTSPFIPSLVPASWKKLLIIWHHYHNLHLWALSPTWAIPQFISPTENVSPWLELSCGWQMDTYYIYNKDFVKRTTILSLYQNSIFNEIKCMYWFKYKIVIGSQRKTSKCYFNFNLIK